MEDENKSSNSRTTYTTANRIAYSFAETCFCLTFNILYLFIFHLFTFYYFQLESTEFLYANKN